MKYLYRQQPCRRQSQAGFTLAELMISTGVFSVVLLICTTAVLVIGQDFRKATIASLTQNTSRNIIDNVTREIQYNPGSIKPDSDVYRGLTVNAVCIGSVRYSYLLGYQLTDSAFDSVKNQSPHVLWRDIYEPPPTPTSVCPPADVTDSSLSGGKELMSLHTRLRAGDGFNVSPGIGTGSSLYNIDVAIIYGDNDVIKDADKCVSISGGGAFCGLSELHTAVFRKAP